jgi:hypothetical protein
LWHSVRLHETSGVSSAVDSSTEEQYRIAILRYLQYDDGYSECVVAPLALTESGGANESFAHSAWNLKQIKYKYLLLRARSLKQWVVTMSPRNKEKSNVIPEFDHASIQFNATNIFSTCRVLSLTHQDYDGRAASLLETHLHDFDFVLPPTRDGLEYRTLFCMSRMTSTAMDRFGATIELERQAIEKAEPHTTGWMMAHLRLAELQTLQALKHVSFGKLRADYADENLLGSSPAYSMRNQPCPRESLKPLFDLFVNDH